MFGAEPGPRRTRTPELADPGQGSLGRLVAVLIRRYPLEAHLSGAVVAQESPKDQPIPLASGLWLDMKGSGFGLSVNT